jgi:protocatechuate 3,4-dioxygenase beta subunit
MHRAPLFLVLLLVAAGGFANEPVVGLPCEGCEAVFVGAPDQPAVRGRIAPVGEPGEPLVLTGLVTGSDGKPRAGVIVYAYQTDASGIYPRPAQSLGRWPDRHGRLRGWARTDDNGRYTFETIRPGAYPGRTVPQHIHMHVIEPGCATYYIDDVHFTDDPLLEPGTREAKRAGSGIVTPRRAGGVWQVTRDIRLGLNIPGHPGCKPAG